MVRSIRARWVRRAVALIATSVSLLVLGAQPASAISVLKLDDSFEQPALWQGYYTAPGDAYVTEIGRLSPRTGQRLGFLQEVAGAGTWASLERTFLAPGGGYTCAASIWIKHERTDSRGHSQLNVEVIDPTTYNYVALRAVDYVGSSPTGYIQYSTGTWMLRAPQQLLFRVSQLGASLPGSSTGMNMVSMVDDLAIRCVSGWPF